MGAGPALRRPRRRFSVQTTRHPAGRQGRPADPSRPAGRRHRRAPDPMGAGPALHRPRRRLSQRPPDTRQTSKATARPPSRPEPPLRRARPPVRRSGAVHPVKARRSRPASAAPGFRPMAVRGAKNAQRLAAPQSASATERVRAGMRRPGCSGDGVRLCRPGSSRVRQSAKQFGGGGPARGPRSAGSPDIPALRRVCVDRMPSCGRFGEMPQKAEWCAAPGVAVGSRPLSGCRACRRRCPDSSVARRTFFTLRGRTVLPRCIGG
ncbi:hypothetical protein EKD16_05245 [Streptomonospora litoralis]|uniref:Uncharacterized protein n=1 Tax=Streptomonospora litoralis TaxID=2498135 RepID=A0A4P6PXJ8_9ACTN|nr:hypothetical protein EKD16_05245 [Streptomonospora litoralis]